MLSLRMNHCSLLRPLTFTRLLKATEPFGMLVTLGSATKLTAKGRRGCGAFLMDPPCSISPFLKMGSMVLVLIQMDSSSVQNPNRMRRRGPLTIHQEPCMQWQPTTVNGGLLRQMNHPSTFILLVLISLLTRLVNWKFQFLPK